MRVRGLEEYDLPSGDRFLKLHHYADPEKGDEWLAALQKEMSATPGEFRREILMDDSVADGQPVYELWNESRHFPASLRGSSIPVIGRSSYICGVDCGQTLQPAACLLQITEGPVYQAHALLEVTSSAGESMETFAPRLVATIQKRLPANWDEVMYEGDPTVTTRDGGRGETAQQVARKVAGILIKPASTNAWPMRKGAVDWLLSDMIDDRTTRFVVDGENCPLLLAGFQGRYKLQVSKSGDSGGPGAVIAMPLKNLYSHVHDGLQYGALRARKLILEGIKDNTRHGLRR